MIVVHFELTRNDGTVCAHGVLGALRNNWVWLVYGNNPGFHFLGDYYSCHLPVVVQDKTLNILPPVSMCLCRNTEMMFRQSYSIVK